MTFYVANGVDAEVGRVDLDSGVAGEQNTEGTNEFRYTLEITSENLANLATGSVLAKTDIPAGVKLSKAILHVKESFGFTTNVMTIGPDSTSATNGLSLVGAQMNNPNIYTLTTFAGTWAAKLAAANTICAGMTTGGAPTTGKATLTLVGDQGV